MSKNKELLNYIYQQRWCSFKSEIETNSIKKIDFFDTEYNNNKKFFIIGNAEFTNHQPNKTFIMPLAKGAIKTEPTVKYKKFITYDATKSNDYWSSLMQELTIDKGLTIANGKYQLIYQSWDNFEYITNHLQDKSTPLNVEQSNSTILVGNKEIAFKQQRIIEFSSFVNPEVEMNYNLLKVGFSAIPKTYGHLSLLNTSGESAFVGIVQEFIPNNGDLWEICKTKLLSLLKKAYNDKKLLSQNGRIKSREYKDIKDLMTLLGKKTEKLMKALKSFKGSPDITPEKITTEYLSIYTSNIKKLIQETKENIKNNLSKLSPDMALNIQNPILTNHIENFMLKNFGKIENRKDKGILMRVHGDFHLGQAIQSLSGEIKFIDFAGEPHLSPEQRKTKHSYMYDIAGMYQSIGGYLPVVVAKRFAITQDENGTETINNEKLLWANNKLKPIISTMLKAFMASIKIDNEWLSIEIFRRNLYEINYEIAYRPQLLFIPVNNLKDMLIGTKYY